LVTSISAMSIPAETPAVVITFTCFDDTGACRFGAKNGEPVESYPIRGPHDSTATSKVDGLRVFISNRPMINAGRLRTPSGRNFVPKRDLTG
jgi:hypothetical protein